MQKRQSNFMTKARNQPFRRANLIKLGYFDGERVFPISVIEKNYALYLYNNRFCFLWKSESVSLIQAN